MYDKPNFTLTVYSDQRHCVASISGDCLLKPRDSSTTSQKPDCSSKKLCSFP